MKLYEKMFDKDLYIKAYDEIKSNPGNMTPGSDTFPINGEYTKDGRNIGWNLIEKNR